MKVRRDLSQEFTNVFAENDEEAVNLTQRRL